MNLANILKAFTESHRLAWMDVPVHAQRPLWCSHGGAVTIKNSIRPHDDVSSDKAVDYTVRWTRLTYCCEIRLERITI